MRKLALILGLVLLSASGLLAQSEADETAQAASGGLDDMFSGAGDNAAGASASKDSALSSLQTSQPLTFTGNLYAMVGAAAGYGSLPATSDLRSGLGELAGGSISNFVYLDARPDSSIRFHGALAMAFPGFVPNMYELWFDYSMADVLFFRGGRQVIGWGNGRIFSVGDVMNNSPTALSLKVYLPFGANGLSLVTLVQDPGAFGDLNGLKPEFAPRLDLVLGPFEFSEAAAFQHGVSTRVASMVKTSQFGIEFFAEAFGNFVPGYFPLLSSFESAFWQLPSQRFSLYAEHYYNGSISNAADGWSGTAVTNPVGHRIALIGSLKVDGLTFGMQWNHAFADNSGQVMPAIRFSPFNHVTVTLGIPVSYGADGSIYANQAPSDLNSPIYYSQNLTNPNLSSPIPTWNQRYSIFLKVALATNY